MSRSVKSIDGVGVKYAEKLSLAGIRTVSCLLEKGKTDTARQQLASVTSISLEKITRWVFMCDLFRVRGIAGQYAELLESAGVLCVKDLSLSDAKSLNTQFQQINARRRLCKILPNRRMIDDWIQQAQSLELVLEI